MKDGKIIIARIFKAYQGPFEYYLHEQMRMLDANRFETICVYLGRRTDKPNPLEKEGFKCFYLSNSYRTRGIKLGVIYRLCKLLKEQRVDIAHCIRHQPAMYAVLASLFVKLPVILYHVHGRSDDLQWSRKLFYFLFGRRFSKVITVSQAVSESMVSNVPIQKSQVLVLENSINYDLYANCTADRALLRRTLDIPLEAFVFVAVGRLVPTKGYSYLLRAFSQVKNRCPRAHLLIVGDGSLRSELEQIIVSMRLNDCIHLLGYRQDVPQLLKISDAFVLSSIHEGFGLVVLEAMAAGLQVIVTDSGGPSEIVQHGYNGFVVKPADAEELAKCMLDQVSTSKENAQRITANATRHVLEKYSHDRIVKSLEAIYESELQRTR